MNPVVPHLLLQWSMQYFKFVVKKKKKRRKLMVSDQTVFFSTRQTGSEAEENRAHSQRED